MAVSTETTPRIASENPETIARDRGGWSWTYFHGTAEYERRCARLRRTREAGLSRVARGGGHSEGRVSSE